MAGFSPYTQGTYLCAVSNTSTSLTLPARPGTVRIYNGSVNTVYIEVGNAAATIPGVGVPGSIPLASGAGSIPLLLEKGLVTNINMIAAVAGPSNVFVTLGHGDTVG